MFLKPNRVIKLHADYQLQGAYQLLYSYHYILRVILSVTGYSAWCNHSNHLIIITTGFPLYLEIFEKKTSWIFFKITAVHLQLSLSDSGAARTSLLWCQQYL